MVNNPPRSRPSGSKRQSSGRVIPNGPLFSLAEVKQLIASGGATVWLANESCSEDVMDLEWDTSNVADLICSLSDSEYRSSEECETDSRATLECDVYVAMRPGIPRWSTKMLNFTYYVKFSLRKLSKNYVAVVSCHLETHKE